MSDGDEDLEPLPPIPITAWHCPLCPFPQEDPDAAVRLCLAHVSLALRLVEKPPADMSPGQVDRLWDLLDTHFS